MEGDSSMTCKLDHLKDQIITQYLNGTDTVVLSETYGVSRGTIRNLLKRYQIPIRGRNHSARKYNWDDTVFDQVDTPEKAYVLGFFYADGCNHQSTNRWIITVVDKDILIKIAEVMKSTMVFDQAEGKTGNHCAGKTVRTAKRQYTLRISSPHLCERMNALGAPPNKTGKTRWPEPHQVPHHLIWHFLRGLLDGDGYITTGINKKNGNPVISAGWCADSHLANGLVEWLNLAGIHGTLRKKRSICEVVVAGRLQVCRMLDLIYNDSTIHMDRKRAKYDKYLDDVNKWSMVPEPKQHKRGLKDG